MQSLRTFTKKSALVPLSLLACGLASACADLSGETDYALPDEGKSHTASAGQSELNPRLLRRFQAIDGPATIDGSAPPKARVALGKRLFSDVRLSANGKTSCNSCHDLQAGGVDGRPNSIGTFGEHGGRNAPTVLNAAGHVAQFWDGRAATVEEQAKGPIMNPIEMGVAKSDDVIEALRADAEYPAEFAAAFPLDAHPLTFDNLAIAIGAFERTLVTPGRWDQYLQGDSNALSQEEKQGLKTFVNAGCSVCHTGRWLGGSMFEKAGVVEPWPNQADQGRFAVTHHDEDRMVFKVPTLRNIAKTAPYFHDGSAATLDAAVEKMARHQLGVALSKSEVTSIVTWMGALSGDVPRETSAPSAQPSGPASALKPSAPAPRATRDDAIGRFMRSQARSAAAAQDFERLEGVFARISSLAPAGYDQWQSFTGQGAAAATAKDIVGVRHACDTCHMTYWERYRSR